MFGRRGVWHIRDGGEHELEDREGDGRNARAAH